MKTKAIYLIICEGDSEYAYVQELNRVLNGRGIPFVLLPCNAHGGGFVSLRQVCRAKKTRRNGRTFILADKDIYARNDGGNGDLYDREKELLPPFLFQVWNFEEFLLMHFAGPVLESWRTVAAETGHRSSPLTGAEFRRVFAHFCEEHRTELGFELPYEKGDMPFALTERRLKILFENSVEQYPRSDMAAFVRELLGSVREK